MSSNATTCVSHLTRACLGAITAVTFVDECRWLLSASGSTVNAYQVSSGRLVAQCRVFDGQRIHSIKVDTIDSHTVVMIFGGKEFSMFEVVRSEATIEFLRLWSSVRSDLIWDAKLLRCESGKCKHAVTTNSSILFDVALGYAHDRVEVISFAAAAKSSQLSVSPATHSSSSQCEDRSLLYSMHLHGSCKHSLIVIGGTVFSHLLVWNASVEAETGSEPRPVVHRLEGHEGVIFRVHTNYDASTICSVSDDRSVRLWSWKSAEPAVESALDVGTIMNPSLGTYQSSAELFGHKARVWRGIISEEWPVVFSCSEDNTCRVWHRESGDVLSSFSGQKGGIWSMDVDSSKRMIALGGGDGSVRLWSLDSVLRKLGSLNVEQSNDLHNVTLLVQECGPSGSTPSIASPVAPPQKKQKIEGNDASSSSAQPGFTAPKVRSPPAEICRELLVDTEDEATPTLYFISSYGRVVKTLLEKKPDSPQLSHQSVLLHQYSHLSALVSLCLSPCKEVLVVGDQRGNLSLISTVSSATPPLFIAGAHSSSVNFLYWISYDDSTLLLLTADAVNEVKVHRFFRVSGHFSLQPLLAFRLPCKARVTCALTINEAKWHQANVSSNAGTSDDEDEEEDDAMAIDANATDASSINGKFLVLGDSRGSVYVYFLSSNFSSSSVAAVYRLMNVHDKSSVASLTLVPTHSGIKLLSTASDACVVEYSLGQRAVNPTSEVDGWFDKHQVMPLSGESVNVDPVSLSFLRDWNLVKKRAHKLSNVSSIYQVFCPPLDSSNRDILVSGFFSMDFVVWNLTQHYQVRRWNCGGDKRSWNHFLIPNSRLSLEEAGFVFCYARHAESKDSISQSGEIVLRWQSASIDEASSSSSTKSFVPSLGSSIHARLTTCLATIELPHAEHLILTSSEDNSIKIYSAHLPTLPAPSQASHLLDSSLAFHSGLSCVSTIVDHPDVVRAIAVSKQPDAHKWLLFSAGGRDYMHASRIHVSGDASATSSASTASYHAGVSVESLCGTGGAVFHVTGKAWQVRKEMDRDRLFKQDLRIMCIAAFPIPSHMVKGFPQLTAHSHCVVTGNSAGLLKFYLFDDQQSEFRLLAECSDHFYTVLSVAHASINQDILVFSGATDGKIMAWSILQLLESAFSAAEIRALELKPLFVQEMHQSGVDCLTVSVHNDRFLLFSGGDDEAIALISAQVSTNNSSRLEGIVTTSWPNAHSSAIKSLATHKSYLYSIGYDQRLRVWRVDTIGGDPQVQIGLTRQGECILDCYDVTTIRNATNNSQDSSCAQLVIAGQGLEVLQVSTSQQ